MLAGDAAHAMLPHLGQGAAQAIEDAAALGVLFKGIEAGKCGQEREIIDARLKLFEEVRRPRVTAVQILSGVPVGEDGFEIVRQRWEKYLPGHELPSTLLPQQSCLSRQLMTDMVLDARCREEIGYLRIL